MVEKIMADFCKQCSIEIWGEDLGDLAGISLKRDTDKEMYYLALCEGCGPIQVDHEGICVSKNCLQEHNK